MGVKVKVVSSNISYQADRIVSNYTYERSTVVQQPGGQIQICPEKVAMRVETVTKVPKVGLMLVGWGGNNGTTLTGMLLANKHKLTWTTKKGVQQPDFLGSVAMSGTFPVGRSGEGEEIFVTVKDLVPMVDPLKLEVDGWDISSMNLGEGLERAGVFEYELQQKLKPLMENIRPRKAAFSQDFIAANQADRADNIIEGNKAQQLEQLRKDIRDFKSSKNLDKIVIMWAGNTERFAEIVTGLNDTWTNLEAAINKNAAEISPSTLYAVASILEDCGFINGSPQNTFVPAVVELAELRGVAIAGDDFKTGQTKLKSVLIDYIVGAGLRPESIVSYNHLGNNDGKNLSAPQTFRSKEISKRGVVEDMVASNRSIYPEGVTGPDHLVVIKYVPYVGDSKRAMDEYVSAIAMGGTNTLVIHNTCEDSLLAAPIMLDLFLFMELFQRITFQVEGQDVTLPYGAILGYWLKAPVIQHTNSLFRQRACIENLIRASLSLPPNSHLFLPLPQSQNLKQADSHTQKSIKKINGKINGTTINGKVNGTAVNGKVNGTAVNGQVSNNGITTNGKCHINGNGVTIECVEH